MEIYSLAKLRLLLKRMRVFAGDFIGTFLISLASSIGVWASLGIWVCASPCENAGTFPGLLVKWFFAEFCSINPYHGHGPEESCSDLVQLGGTTFVNTAFVG